MKVILKIIDAFFKFVEYVAAVVLPAVTLVAFYQIISRYIFRSSNAGIDELTRMAFVWCASLGSALAFRKGAHLGVTALVRKLKGAANTAMNVFIQCAVIFLMCLVLSGGLHLAKMGAAQYSEYLRLSMVYFYACIPFGAVCSIIACIENIIVLLLGGEPDTGEEGAD